jgi:hypothetical protein
VIPLGEDEIAILIYVIVDAFHGFAPLSKSLARLFTAFSGVIVWTYSAIYS